MRNCLENVRKMAPLVHNITNYVTVNDVANVILAAGASPIMADDEDEVEEITALCNALNINIGTLNKRTVCSMIKAGNKAVSLGNPVLFDPVGAGASRLRTQTALKLIHEISFSAIRGNISEIKTIAAGTGSTKGVDADIADVVTEKNLSEAVSFIKDVAKKQNAIIVATGAIDLVSDSNQCYVIRNGEALMSSITGTGCQLSGMMAAYLAANKDNMLKAAATAVCAMGLAGEIAKKHLKEYEGNATYRNRIIDSICHMDGDALEEGAQYEIR